MNDWRSGLLLRTFQRLALRFPVVLVLVWAYASFSLQPSGAWDKVIQALGIEPSSSIDFALVAIALIIAIFLLVFLTITGMRRPLWERHSVRLVGLLRGSMFGVLTVLACSMIAVAFIVLAQMLAPINETPRAYLLLHRLGLFAATLLCIAPGLFALVVCVRERQGYATIGRVWRIDRAQTIRGIFLIAVLTTCIAGVAFVGAYVSWGIVELVSAYSDGQVDSISADGIERRIAVSTTFTIIAFTTAHVVQYERIRDWESGGDVTGVFD